MIEPASAPRVREANGAPATQRAPRRRPRWRLIGGGGAAMAIGLLALAAAALLQRSAAPPMAAVATEAPLAAQANTVRGQVRPIAQARVAALSGGVLERLIVAPGDPVNEHQEIARIRGSVGIEVLTAPFAGTVTAAPARPGDTLLPGATVALIGDLSRFQVETSDVDEFLIPHVRRGGQVTVYVEALKRELPGQVRTVALEPTRNAEGDEHYLVAIDLLELPPGLRVGMSARVQFLDV